MCTRVFPATVSGQARSNSALCFLLTHKVRDGLTGLAKFSGVLSFFVHYACKQREIEDECNRSLPCSRRKSAACFAGLISDCRIWRLRQRVLLFTARASLQRPAYVHHQGCVLHHVNLNGFTRGDFFSGILNASASNGMA